MSEKELEQNRKEMLKKACIGNAIMLSLIVIAIILAVFAWFTSLDSHTSIRGINYKSGDNYDIRMFTQVGTVLNDNSLSFSGNNLNDGSLTVPEKTVFPGEKFYYKTTIENYELSVFKGSLTLQNLLVNRQLVDATKTYQTIEQTDGTQVVEAYSTAINFRVEARYNSDLNSRLDYYECSSCQYKSRDYFMTCPNCENSETAVKKNDYPKLKDSLFYLTSPQNYVVDGVVDDQYYLFNTQYICSNITIPKYENGEPGRFEIIWEFQVDGDKILNINSDGSEIMGASLMIFNNMRFLVDLSES